MKSATFHKIYIKDSRNMSEVESNAVHLALTSPPYVTTTMCEGQIFPFQQYLDLLESVSHEIWRVLAPGGRFCLNIADIRTKYLEGHEGKLYRAPLSYEAFRILLDLGFRYLDTWLWQKGFNRNFGGPLLGSYPYPTTIYNNVYFEYIHVFEKPGKRLVSKEQKEASRLSLEEWKEYVQRIWHIPTETEKFKLHDAVWPVEIPRRLIKLYSFVGDTILDPFGGTCTATLAAMELGRSSICYEINPEYVPVIRKRLKLDLEENGSLGLDLRRPQVEIVVKEPELSGEVQAR